MAEASIVVTPSDRLLLVVHGIDTSVSKVGRSRCGHGRRESRSWMNGAVLLCGGAVMESLRAGGDGGGDGAGAPAFDSCLDGDEMA